MSMQRASGIVLHPTSLPGPFGVGDLGPSAHEFVDFLRASGCGIWQLMPLGPTGFGDSPYQCFSAFAGNPLLISPELLLEEGFLAPEDLESVPEFPEDQVAFSEVIDWKMALLEKAFALFEAEASPWQTMRFERFVDSAANAFWLEDYALFRALKDHHGGDEWVKWDGGLVRREADALEYARGQLEGPIRKRKFFQWIFFEQWNALRQHAQDSGVQMMGDVPIFVAHDSADAWSCQREFLLNEEGRPLAVAGVPPDYFSPTGQLWGNPLYNWEQMEAGGFSWWVRRMRSAFRLFDLVRLDHFRGFEAFWSVPADHETAENGSWVKAPGKALFESLRKALGPVPIIAEDLGVITPEVEALRDGFDFPGMKVLQFSFGDNLDHDFLPHNVDRHTVVYTGTHDNDTTLGWYEKATDVEKDHCRRYLGRDGRDVCWDMMRAAIASVADTALIPLQDLMGLGSEARMNTPGKASGNWSWRFREEDLTPDLVTRLLELNTLYGRLTKS
jgi:4-alpha-glucanotransferase